ncbi:HK97 family phage prohead protease [Paracraurococcus lichenis]|uniref:HK97 family phage prohead protease n=1 Tax=Paracraurococcus lichenis TaxID=3064888 RepID=A0ABT9E7P2_9PROT|nr:HK97 family phage prohead protease [Paracraurococcus sp. LOR1-02]MDO9711975.1 HK97 family phage prohead protease [Paracraurococcus sp. LOR1-02]
MKYVSSTEFKKLSRKALPAGVGIRKQFDAVIEQLPDRCLKFTISSDAVDRQNDSVNQEGWQLANYLKNPVVLWSHNQDEPPVGKCISIGVEDGKLKAVVQFMPESVPVYGAKAEAIFRMCCDGYLNATSVGFRPLEWSLSKDPARGADEFEPGADFHSAELVEFSIVSVPCNPEAIIEPIATFAEPDAVATEQENESKQLNNDAISTRSKVLSRERLKMQAYLLSLT